MVTNTWVQPLLLISIQIDIRICSSCPQHLAHLTPVRVDCAHHILSDHAAKLENKMPRAILDLMIDELQIITCIPDLLLNVHFEPQFAPLHQFRPHQRPPYDRNVTVHFNRDALQRRFAPQLHQLVLQLHFVRRVAVRSICDEFQKHPLQSLYTLHDAVNLAVVRLVNTELLQFAKAVGRGNNGGIHVEAPQLVARGRQQLIIKLRPENISFIETASLQLLEHRLHKRIVRQISPKSVDGVLPKQWWNRARVTLDDWFKMSKDIHVQTLNS